LLPINLATALRLAGARPIVIAAAQASVKVAEAELARARVLWFPSLHGGLGYYRHDGASQGGSGKLDIESREQFMAGGGLVARFAATDALFEPLVARQVLRARQLDVQRARNEALLTVADAYFRVQEARGRVAGTEDVVDKAQALTAKVRAMAPGPLEATDVRRAQTNLDAMLERLTSAREEWRLASADLTQALRLDPSAVIAPLEAPFLRVTLISPKHKVDDLIPIGLTNRPELASQQALVQAALVRIKEERMRPLIPSLILQGNNPPSANSDLQAGIFGSGAGGVGKPWLYRDDVRAELVWSLDNMGLGNREMVCQRKAEQQQMLIELFRLQDLVAADVVRAHTVLASAATRLETAATTLQNAQLTYTGSLDELGKITKVGDVKVLAQRSFEVVDALRALEQAYDGYFANLNDYNRAQFRLYRALGYPAGIVECARVPGPVLPVDTARPPQMAPVCPTDPCPCRR
jgi:outer membrane protein TolC